MLPWMLGGLAVVGFFAWRVIHNAEEHDKKTKEARRKGAR
jgi:hypothetical protein